MTDGDTFRGEEFFRTFCDYTYDWEFWLAQDGWLLYVSPSCERITGYAAEAFMQDPELLMKIVHPEDQPALEQHVVHELRGSKEMLAVTYRIISRSGEQRWIEHICRPVYGRDGSALGRRVSNRDITDLKRAEAPSTWLASFPQSNLNPITELDLSGGIHYINPAALELFPDLQQRGVSHPWLADWDTVARVYRKGETHRSLREVTVNGRSYQQDIYYTGQGPYIRIYGLDITDYKMKERELQQLNRTLMAHNSSSRAMMHATNEAEYLQDVCRIIAEECGYAILWIGFAENDAAKTVRPVAYAGFEEGYLETLKPTWADTERGRGPTGTAIRTGKPYRCMNILTDPAFAPWREEAVKRGYASSIGLPLMADGKAFGALSVYSSEPESFSEDEVALLAQLADDLSYGIMAIRLRDAHTRAEGELRQSEKRYRSLFNGMTEGFALHEIICDGNGTPCDYRFLDINPAFERMTGLKREDVVGRTVLEALPHIEPYWIRTYGQVALTREPVHLDQSTATLGRHYEVFAYSPAPRQFACVFLDITDRKAAEEALRESREDLNRAQVVAQTGSWRMDVQHNELRWSEESHRIFGIPMGTPLTYETFLSTIHPRGPVLRGQQLAGGSSRRAL